MCVLSVIVTLKCFPFIMMFYMEHIRVQLVLRNVYSYHTLCVSFENTIHLRGSNIVLNVKFHFAGEFRGFVHCVCV